MSLFDWFTDRRNKVSILRIMREAEESDSLWSKCPECSIMSHEKDLIANSNVCSNCSYHYMIDSESRIAIIADKNSFEPLNENLLPIDPLGFKDRHNYAVRLKDTQSITRLTEAVITGVCKLEGLPLALGVMDFRFIGGSMGSVVGEKITRMIELATYQSYPILIVCASGGARMQEGVLSLVQMAKISGALSRHREARQLYLPLLTHPTTGGVTASFAMLGDIILAEPKALIGFAGRRVIEQTLQEKLPDNFQTSEYLQEHGFVDYIVQRTALKSTLARILRLHGYTT